MALSPAERQKRYREGKRNGKRNALCNGVTKSVTEDTLRNVTEKCAECERLREEVSQLKGLISGMKNREVSKKVIEGDLPFSKKRQAEGKL